MSRRAFMYEIEIRHPGLNAYRHIRGRDKWVVEQKAAAQMAKWDEQWDRKLEVESKRLDREAAAAAKEEKKAESDRLTIEAQAQLSELETVLQATLAVDDKIDWADMKDFSQFGEKKPARLPVSPAPEEPDQNQYVPKIGLWGTLFPAIKKKRIELAAEAYDNAESRWKRELKKHYKLIEEREADFEEKVEAWDRRRLAFEKDQAERNAIIDDLALRYRRGEADAIEEYVDLVLSRSVYPDWIQRDWEIEFQKGSRILVLNYDLPLPSDLPRLREVKYVASRDAFDEKFISDAQIKKNYDSLVYQICLRTIHEIYESDREQVNIEAIVFNGITQFTDPATGHPAKNCICTVQANRAEFDAINLENVDPKTCFKALKGVAASQLQSMAPVAPLMRLDREDARFIPGEDVSKRIEEGENIAAMDWKDFEHLIRQVFESEFSGEGSEVKVTQGSRDGGVDAIAFDPDPIRGGKIVIQAKRYTNTVGVEAVRDLYGTVVNEGASKGILVTTAQFGPEARKFASNKPIALIDGQNLLFLLSNIGVKAKIDIVAAKQQFREAGR